MGSETTSIFASMPTVFLVEDNPTDSYLARMALERAIAMPLQVVAADTGEYALDLLRHHCAKHKAPNVVLLDLSLPDISGHEVLGEVRKDPLLKSVPVVIFTGSDDPEDRGRALGAGADDYWVKPMGMLGYMDIMRRLRVYLGKPSR